MADVKTHLRELGVLVGVSNSINNLGKDPNTITVSEFCAIADSLVPTSKHVYYNNIRTISFGVVERSIIVNAFNLANYIILKLNISTLTSSNWYGYDSGKVDPVDIEINNMKFSLKEDSFILENMGLYKLVNCYTGTTYKKRHIFKDYAPVDYDNWFTVTWNLLIKYLSENSNVWNYINPKNYNKTATIILSATDVKMIYNNGVSQSSAVLPITCTLIDYEKSTDSDIREGVFAKFIKTNLEHDALYNSAKKTCAVNASNALANELLTKFKYSPNLARFLRIHTNQYYYAKTTAAGVELYDVPGFAQFTKTIEVVSIVGSVPDKQANILTTIKNLTTGKELVLRNECRFSHGQFNGTPEAKLYYDNGCTLEVIYNKL